MIRKLVLAPLLAVGLALVAAAPAAAAPVVDVTGIWVNKDPVDGSNQALVVSDTGSSGVYRLVLFDDNATVACDSVPVILTGKAELSGDTLYAELSGFCFDGTPSGPFGVKYTYDAGPPETLKDSFGAVWKNLF